jgi:hypothetical protein
MTRSVKTHCRWMHCGARLHESHFSRRLSARGDGLFVREVLDCILGCGMELHQGWWGSWILRKYFSYLLQSGGIDRATLQATVR